MELGLTQSAVSQSLRKLRVIFHDELFLRRPHGMEPTATALRLEPSISSAVDALSGALGAAQTFAPEKAQGVFRIAAHDPEQASVVPLLAARLSRKAPGLRLVALPPGRKMAIAALEDNRAQLATGFFEHWPDHLVCEIMYMEEFLVVGSRSVLDEHQPLTLETYLNLDHVLMSPAGELKGIVDDTLELMGRSRKVVLALPSFLPVMAAASATGALATLPSRVARRFAANFGLVVSKPPFALPGFPVMALWHRRNDRDPRLRWILDELRAALSSDPYS